MIRKSDAAHPANERTPSAFEHRPRGRFGFVDFDLREHGLLGMFVRHRADVVGQLGCLVFVLHEFADYFGGWADQCAKNTHFLLSIELKPKKAPTSPATLTKYTPAIEVNEVVASLSPIEDVATMAAG